MSDSFEYKAFNISEIDRWNKANKVKKNLFQVMNDHGREGWEILFKLTDGSFLMKRRIVKDASLPYLSVDGALPR